MGTYRARCVLFMQMVALYKDPEGTSMFSKQQPASSFHARHHSNDFSLSLPKQRNEQSTTSEVELLRKRVNELESRLATLQQESNGTNGLDYKVNTEFA